jgi:hypothetical protein
MTTIPMIGDRVERRVAGISQYGTVHYSDQLQVLIKWDDGSSSSLRLDIHKLRVIGRSSSEARPSEPVVTSTSREAVPAEPMLTSP